MSFWGKSKLEERVKILETQVEDILKLLKGSPIKPNANPTPSSDTQKPVNSEPKTIPTPVGVDNPARKKMTADLQKLCGLINSKLKVDNLETPACIDNGLTFVTISHSLQSYNKTDQTINTNFDFIVTYMLENIDLCTAIRSRSKTEGHFDIWLTREGGDIRIKTSFSGNPRDPDFCIMLSKN